LHTLPRLADFLRLSDDEKMTPTRRSALAISGWLLGNDSGTENLAVALNLFEVRNQVRAYLNATGDPERTKIIDQLRSLEGSDRATSRDCGAHEAAGRNEGRPRVQGPPGVAGQRRASQRHVGVF